jgi:hypothetical protein
MDTPTPQGFRDVIELPQMKDEVAADRAKDLDLVRLNQCLQIGNNDRLAKDCADRLGHSLKRKELVHRNL